MADGTKPAEATRLGNELVWMLDRIGIIWRHWSMPLSSASSDPPISTDDGVSARTLALVTIVALTFAVRGEMQSLGGKVSFTAMAATLAALLSALLNFASKNFNIKIKEEQVISAYASTILMMFLFIVIQTLCTGMDWYERYAQEYGSTVLPAALALVITYGVLLVKSLFVDKAHVTVASAASGFGVVLGSGGIIVLVAQLSKEAFDRIVCWLLQACV